MKTSIWLSRLRLCSKKYFRSFSKKIKKDNQTKKPLLIYMGILTFLFSCQKSAMEDIKNAQICLNKATPQQAQSCVSKIASDPSFQANQLKCSAHFIEQGYGDPARLIDLIKNDNPGCGGGACSDSVNIISAIAFNDVQKAAAAFEVCRMSNTPVYTVLSSFAQIATKAKDVMPAITDNDPEEYSQAIDAMPPEDLGEIAVLTYKNSCVHKTLGSGALSDYCAEVSTALEGYDLNDHSAYNDIGTCLKFKLTGIGVDTC